MEPALPLEERVKQLEMKYVRDSVNSSLVALYRTLEKPRFEVADAVNDLESLVKSAKTSNDPRTHEFQCVLDEVEKRSKQLPAETIRDLMIDLIGDPVRSKVLGKVTKMLKQITPTQQNQQCQQSQQYEPYQQYQQYQP